MYDKHGLYIQKLNYSCGPCSLINALTLKGEDPPSEQTAVELCKARPGVGTSNEDLIEAAKALRLKVVLTKADADLAELEALLDQKHYVIINYLHAFDGDGHYGLVTEHDQEAIYLFDCSLGFLRLKKPDLLKHWYNADKSIYGWLLALD